MIQAEKGLLMPGEKILIERTRAGDMEAFDELFHRHSQKLYSFAFSLLKDHTQTEDLVQDIFITVWERREQINPAYHFENYLFTICYHSVLKYFRRKKIEQRVISEILKSTQGKLSESTNSLHYRELEQAINLVVESMPPRRKKVYKMSREDGLSIQEIAGELNITSRTVETHISHSLKQIRTTLENIFPELRVRSPRGI